MGDKVKVAFCCVIYKNFNQSCLLIDTLRTVGDVFIHVNAYNEELHNELKIKYIETSNVHLIENRYKVHWGGFSNIKALIELFKEAQKVEPDYYQYITGLDFPIKPMSKYLSFLKENFGANFITIHKVSENQENRQIFSYHYWVETPEYRNDVALRAKDNFTSNKEFQEGHRKYVPYSWELMRSRPTYCLYKDAVKEIIRISADPVYNALYEYTIAADEYYIPTIVWNLGMIQKPTLTWMSMGKQDVIAMTGQTGSDFVTEEDFAQIENHGNYYYARKFDDNINGDLLKNVAKKIKE